MEDEKGLYADEVSDISDGEMVETWMDLGKEYQEGRERRAKRILIKEKAKREDKEPQYKQERRSAEREEGLRRLDAEKREKLQRVGKTAIEEYEKTMKTMTPEERILKTMTPEERIFERFGGLLELGERTEWGRYEEEESVTSRKEVLEKYGEAKIGTEGGLYKLSVLAPKEAIQAFCESEGEHFEQKLDYLEKGLERIEGLDWHWHGNHSDFIRIRIRETVMEASMIGTPEYSAYVAGKHEQQNGYGRISETYPVTTGNYNGIWFGEIGDWKDICGEYKRIEDRVRRQKPRASEEEIRKWAIGQAKKIYKDSYGFQDPSRSHMSEFQPTFSQAVAWAQMGKMAQKRLKEVMRRDMRCLEGVERFVGRAGEDVETRLMIREYEFSEGEKRYLLRWSQ